MPISDVLQKNVGIGGVISLLWFQRCLPPYVCKFFEMCLMVTADHGPAVSGAHNTIVCARAGKDLVSSLVSGLLTIGDRFGGALDGAAKTFSDAYDKGKLTYTVKDVNIKLKSIINFHRKQYCCFFFIRKVFSVKIIKANITPILMFFFYRKRVEFKNVCSC